MDVIKFGQKKLLLPVYSCEFVKIYLIVTVSHFFFEQKKKVNLYKEVCKANNDR